MSAGSGASAAAWGLHDDQRVGDRLGVNLPPGCVVADGRDMHTRRQPLAPYHRLGRAWSRTRCRRRTTVRDNN